jgi:Na+/H+-translocating membrane pyrophosphatase
MRGLLLSISIVASMALVFWIQTFHFNMGYLVGAVLIAIHFFVVVLYSTRRGER